MKKNSYIQSDFLSSIVVFLVALPLCLGISIASGTPPIYGLISGIIGGIIIGTLGGAPLQVSGPAAGLAVMVYEFIQSYGIEALGALGVVVGLFQLSIYFFKLADYFKAISPSLIKGLLGGIGILILSSQVYIAFDTVPAGGGLDNLIKIPQAFSSLIIESGNGRNSFMIAIITLLTIILWGKLGGKAAKTIPPPLLAVIVATGSAQVLGYNIKFVSLPDNIMGELNILNTQSFNFLTPIALLKMLGISFVATAETLLSTSAIDRLSKKQSNYNKEMMGQGIGNFIAGILGALPITGVIVRSSANIHAGAKTKLSAIFHGLWLLIMVFVFSNILRYIPMSSLAGILIFTGWKLLDIQSIPELIRKSRSESIIYFVTLSLIVSVDLLTGVVIGFICSIALLAKRSKNLQVKTTSERNMFTLNLKGEASFMQIPRMTNIFTEIEAEKSVTIDTRELTSKDWAFEENIQQKCIELESRGIKTLLITQ
jgi:MFS superfamily sulfate permease-like transporter